MTQEINYIDIALKYLKTGLSIIPTEIKSKKPLVKWKQYQEALPAADEIRRWFAGNNNAMAVVAGKVSGNLEIIDIDNHFGDAEKVFADFCELLDGTAPGLLEKLVIAQTQGGGYHIYYRSDFIEGNLKLARRWKGENAQDTIIETRGEGGYALIAPTDGYKLVRGRLSQLHSISAEEREILITIARSFTEIEDSGNGKAPDENYIHQTQAERPGDAFNKTGEIISLLKRAGWELLKQENGKEYWRRPGKETAGYSATFNFIPDKLFCFSSNCHPFESNRTYDKFSVYAILEHNGNFKEAAKSLAEKGFGSRESAAGKKKKKAGELSGPDSDVETDTLPSSNIFGVQKHTINDKIESWLTENYDLRYNVVKSYPEHKLKTDEKWEPVTDRVTNEMWRNLSKVYTKLAKNKIEQIIDSNFTVDYNPIKEYFNSLPEWDGENHIENYTKLIKVQPEQEGNWFTYFNKWIVGVVACAMERGLNHTCLVLVGAQGTGKTTILGKLVPEQLKNYYSISQMNPKDKDSKILITESFLINLDELESSTREEIGHLKSLMTIDQVVIRKPFGRRAEPFRRRASFCGSVNKSLFLTDITGTRRFLTVDIVDINLNGTVNIEQIYAQALWKLNSGFEYWFSKNEVEKINESNRQYQIIRPEEELLLSIFSPYNIEGMTNEKLMINESAQLCKILSCTEIFDEIQKKTTIKLSHHNLGLILKQCGFHQRLMKYQGRAKRCYIVKINKDNDNEQESVGW